jgi:hypothetical protein
MVNDCYQEISRMTGCGRTRTVESLISRRPFNVQHHPLDLARFQVTLHGDMLRELIGTADYRRINQMTSDKTMEMTTQVVIGK